MLERCQPDLLRLAQCLCLCHLGSVSIALERGLGMAGLILLVCVPASRAVARIVEKKKYTFTVGGASFVGLVAAPLAIELLNRLPGEGVRIPAMPVMAALAIAYAFGEGMGRLACISFGCCYGKPVSQAHPLIRGLFERRHFIFRGKTKKIAYAGGMEGREVIPIQAITSVVLVAVGLFGMLLFVRSHMIPAFVLTTMATQGWRLFSETLRADYRGGGELSAYQIMAILSVIYAMALPLILPLSPPLSPDLPAGLAALWSPLALISLQALWLGIFILTGRSMVTGAVLSFHVHEDRI